MPRIFPLQEVVVTVGATQAIFATVHALIESGDEAVLIEPAYDSYPATVSMAGGITRFVPLRVQDPTATTSNRTYIRVTMIPPGP